MESGSKNIEIAVLRRDAPLSYLSEEEVEKLCADIEKEKQEEEDAKKKKSGSK